MPLAFTSQRGVLRNFSKFQYSYRCRKYSDLCETFNSQTLQGVNIFCHPNKMFQNDNFFPYAAIRMDGGCAHVHKKIHRQGASDHFSRCFRGKPRAITLWDKQYHMSHNLHTPDMTSIEITLLPVLGDILGLASLEASQNPVNPQGIFSLYSF